MAEEKSLVGATALLLLAVVYLGAAIVSEERKYGKWGLDYLMLTPKVLKGFSHLCVDIPRFTYRSADGPKPAVISLDCQMEEGMVLKRLEVEGYLRNEGNAYKRDKKVIEISPNQSHRINRVTVLEYL